MLYHRKTFVSDKKFFNITNSNELSKMNGIMIIDNEGEGVKDIWLWVMYNLVKAFGNHSITYFRLLFYEAKPSAQLLFWEFFIKLAVNVFTSRKINDFLSFD